jgi:hypothetical protein
MDENPFGAPGADAFAALPDVQAALRGTRWAVLVVSAFFALGCLLLLCGGLSMLLMSAASVPEAGGAELSSGMMVALGVAYLVFAVTYVPPTWLLFAYGRDLGRFLAQPTGERLVAALHQQRRFWAVSAVVLVAVVVLYVLVVVAAVAIGVARTGAAG